MYNYARRGRGDSGDTRPYAVEREIEDLAALLAAGRRGEALELFMRRVGSPEEVTAARLATITRPTLVTTGGPRSDPHVSGQPPDFFDRAADAIAVSIPQAQRHTFAGQGHAADPTVVAPVLTRFFGR